MPRILAGSSTVAPEAVTAVIVAHVQIRSRDKAFLKQPLIGISIFDLARVTENCL